MRYSLIICQNQTQTQCDVDSKKNSVDTGRGEGEGESASRGCLWWTHFPPIIKTAAQVRAPKPKPKPPTTNHHDNSTTDSKHRSVWISSIWLYSIVFICVVFHLVCPLPTVPLRIITVSDCKYPTRSHPHFRTHASIQYPHFHYPQPVFHHGQVTHGREVLCIVHLPLHPHRSVSVSHAPTSSSSPGT